MTEENTKLDTKEELCRFYRDLTAIQIAAVDYVRGKDDEEDHLQRVAERAKEVTMELKELTKKSRSSLDAQPIPLSSEEAGKPKTLQFLQQAECEDQTWCWDPVTKTCEPC